MCLCTSEMYFLLYAELKKKSLKIIVIGSSRGLNQEDKG